jgi:hypothetical protein
MTKRNTFDSMRVNSDSVSNELMKVIRNLKNVLNWTWTQGSFDDTAIEGNTIGRFRIPTVAGVDVSVPEDPISWTSGAILCVLPYIRADILISRSLIQ